ncbi:MAG: hypothetical protein JWM65_3425 [Sphingomonas bacterium]|nr:hypothetical protein [Sphingomonas bacterium]
MVTVGGMINGGFRLVRERPLAVLAWGVIYMVATLAMMATVFVPFMQLMMANAAAPNSVDPAQTFALMGEMYLVDFGLLLVFTVLISAALRASLRPSESSFASIRVGMDELRLIGLSLVLVIAFFVMMLVLGIVVGIVFAAIGLAASGGGAPSGAGVAGIGIGFVLMTLVIYAAPIFFAVRLSPAYGLTMLRRKIVIGEAWSLTSGKFWVMFGGYLVLGLIMAVAYFVIALVVFIPAIAAAGGAPGMVMAMSQGQFGGTLGVMLAIGAVLMTVLAGVGIAVWAGAIGAATNGLLGTTDVDLEETFA